MKKAFKRSLSVLLALILLCGIVPLTGLNATAANYTTDDLITFGSYPQTKVTNAGLIAQLNAQTLQADNTVTYSGSKYLQQTDWYQYEPIQWRVLSNTNGELFVLAEKILDCKQYGQYNPYTGVTWESCALRAWLNNDFYNAAFTSAEQSKIETSTVINDNNPWFATEGGNNTNDKLVLLSYAEAMNPAYSFNSSYSAYDTARRAQGSDYAKSLRLSVSDLGNGFWWLRTPGYDTDDAIFVNFGGDIYKMGHSIYNQGVGVRPAFNLHLTSDIFTSKSYTDCAVNALSGFVYGLDPGITSLEGYTETAAGYETQVVQPPSGFGTGTAVNITLEGVTAESYGIIIFGDVTGDGNIDSLDAGTMVDVENYLVAWDTAEDAALFKAGDLNGDGGIDSLDAGIAVDAENYMVTIDQSTGLVAGG